MLGVLYLFGAVKEGKRKEIRNEGGFVRRPYREVWERERFY